jgi:UDP-glucuronate decarboxylase
MGQAMKLGAEDHEGHSSLVSPHDRVLILTSNPRPVLVTGGAGFLGSHLCERLLASGHEVICLDNFSTGRLANIEHLRHEPGFTVRKHDVALPMSARVSQIYNLACPASPPDYQADPVATTTTSVLGALNLLELARQKGCRLLQASTSEVYGDPHVHPQPETYWGNVNPVGPRSCYDEGKRCAETLCSDYRDRYGVETKIARIFNTYGPRMRPDDGRVVSNFIVQALRGDEITVYGDGSQTRSFCYVDDLIDGLIGLMATAPAFMGPVNLGNPREFTVRELAEEVLDLTGSRSRIVHRPLPKDDPRKRQPDIALAAREFGWRPRISLREGLGRTILYFESLLAGQAGSMAESA